MAHRSKFFHISLSCAAASIFFFSTTSAQQVNFPYKINFTESELKLINSLDPLTKQKLLKVAELTYQKSTSVNAAPTTNTTATTYSNTYSTTTPYYNPSTGQYQSSPAPQTQQANPYLGNNPYQNSPYERYYAQNQQQYPNSPTGGYDNNFQPLDTKNLGDLPKLGSGGQNCTNNFGVDGSLNGTSPRVKFDTNRICVAFGRRIKVVSAFRGGTCHSGSQHSCGTAVDYEVKTYGDRKQQALLVVAWIALGYNIGSYERGFPLHADHENSGAWKTWSRWAHTNGKAPLPYEDAVRDALSLIEMPANSASEFRSKYGYATKATMIGKAKAFLEKAYGADAAKFTPANG
jgi:hypothetical protein